MKSNDVEEDETFTRSHSIELSSDFSVVKISVIDWNVLSDEEVDEVDGEIDHNKWTWMENEKQRKTNKL